MRRSGPRVSWILGAFVGLLLVVYQYFPLGLAGRLSGPGNPSRGELTIAAAADLRGAMDEIIRAYEARTGIRVMASYGSSGQLAQQIENGAPFDVFLSADWGYIERLRRGGHTVPGTERLYARGRLALVVAPNFSKGLRSLSDLQDPALRYLAIANPDHAPYGRAARQVLERAGLWEALQSKIVLGENILQAFQFVRTGQADAGLVALALALPSDLEWALIPLEFHEPIDQGLAVLRRASHESLARDFTEFILSVQGQEILRRYGFEDSSSIGR
ncbi:MAG: molybdate ABC transporter substrate-binding protein [Anaerolineae bacterium]|nr:molybdate ABC transporter substrate-binding protein [Thermoflexus sp.]MDW8065030.1 molybdate ABC transporter substrate-binding protein [Anaerolineae bacterium]